VSWLLSLLPGVRVVYHEHDCPLALPGLFLRRCGGARRALARRAATCVLPNEVRADWFARRTGAKNVVVVWNCPDRREVLPPRPPAPPGPLRVYYHGGVSEALLPMSLLPALARLGGAVRLDVVGYEALFPPKSGDLNLDHCVGASNKPFDYLSAGLALLVSDLEDWRRAYVEPGYALACDREDPESVAAALGWYAAHRAEARGMSERGRQRVETEWNYQSQFEPIWQLLHSPNR
jgi:hypothetical protein